MHLSPFEMIASSFCFCLVSSGARTFNVEVRGFVVALRGFKLNTCLLNAEISQIQATLIDAMKICISHTLKINKKNAEIEAPVLYSQNRMARSPPVALTL